MATTLKMGACKPPIEVGAPPKEIIVNEQAGLGYCEDCLDNDKETQGYSEWELYEGPCLCIDCVNERHRGKPVPQEWLIEDE